MADGSSAQRSIDELSVLSRDAVPQPSYRGAALLKLTSGSTGLPKAVLTTEVQLLADTEHIVSAMGITAADVQLAAIPLSHAYGFGNLVMPLLLQGTPIVLRESFVPHQLSADARQYGARVFHGVPFMYQHYLAHPPVGGWPPTLTLLVSAGARLELETVRGFHERFGLKIHSFYGTSESGGIAFDGDDELDDVPTVGRPMPGVTIDLRPDAGVPPGHGRIHVRSLAVCPGYVGETAESDELGEDGFLTGDYGRFLADGRLVLAGRVSSFINVAGRKVQPGEVERVLREHGRRHRCARAGSHRRGARRADRGGRRGPARSDAGGGPAALRLAAGGAQDPENRRVRRPAAADAQRKDRRPRAQRARAGAGRIWHADPPCYHFAAVSAEVRREGRSAAIAGVGGDVV